MSAHVCQQRMSRAKFIMHFRFKCVPMINRCPWDFKIPGKCVVNLPLRTTLYWNIKSTYMLPGDIQ